MASFANPIYFVQFCCPLRLDQLGWWTDLLFVQQFVVRIHKSLNTFHVECVEGLMNCGRQTAAQINQSNQPS